MTNPDRTTSPRSAPPVVTELLGLPGAGKSTVGSEVDAWPTVQTVSRWTGLHRWTRLPVTFEMTLRSPAMSAVTYLAAVTRRGVTAVHLRRVSSVQRRHLIVKKLPRDTVVLDEGPVHALFVALYGTRETVLSRPLLRLALASLSRYVDRYLFLDIPKEQCIENFRRADRSSVRFNADSPDQAVEAFRRDETHRQIMDGLRRVAADKVVRVTSPAAAYAILLGHPPSPTADGDRVERFDSR